MNTNPSPLYIRTWANGYDQALRVGIDLQRAGHDVVLLKLAMQGYPGTTALQAMHDASLQLLTVSSKFARGQHAEQTWQEAIAMAREQTQKGLVQNNDSPVVQETPALSSQAKSILEQALQLSPEDRLALIEAMYKNSDIDDGIR